MRSGIDLYEELMWEGENPRTTLVMLRSDVPLVEDEAAGAEFSEPVSDSKDVVSAATVIWGLGSSAHFGSEILLASGARYE